MLALMIILGILTWLIIGAITGRVLFVKILGTKPRRIDSYADVNTNKSSLYYKQHNWEITEEYNQAMYYMLWSLGFWFVTIPLYLMQAPTPYEIELQKLEKAKELDERIKQLDIEYIKFVRSANRMQIGVQTNDRAVD